jgi:hypothetical protein
MQVVLAATDNLLVNGEVIRLCHQKGILCSAADANWTESDFMVPATLRKPHLTLTLSTGGESCRRARLTKDYLARHLDILRSADLMVVSVEQARPASKRAALELGAVLQQIWGIHEFLVLNQRTRLEVLAVVAVQTPVAAELMETVVRTRFPGRCRITRGPAAVQYMAKGLGHDPRTHGVIGGALSESTRAGWAGPMMKEWLEAGIRLAETNRNAHAEPLKSGFSKLNREYQRQYESIIRSI